MKGILWFVLSLCVSFLVLIGIMTINAGFFNDEYPGISIILWTLFACGIIYKIK